MLDAQLVVPEEQVVVHVALPELLEEETAPHPQLLHRRHLLQLVNVALPVVHVKGVEVVAGQLRLLHPRLHRPPHTPTAQDRLPLFLLHHLRNQQEVAKTVRVDLLGQKNQQPLTELKTQRVNRSQLEHAVQKLNQSRAPVRLHLPL